MIVIIKTLPYFRYRLYCIKFNNRHVFNRTFMLMQHELVKSNNDIFHNRIHEIMFTALQMFNEMLDVMKQLQNYIEGIELKRKV